MTRCSAWNRSRPWNRNAVLLYFTDPGLRRLWPDWADGAPRVVRQFRAAMARHGGEPAWTVLLDRLRQASPDFSRLWERGGEDGAGGPGNVPERFVHPVAGTLRLARFRLWAEPRGRGSRRRRLRPRRRGDGGQTPPPAGTVHRRCPGLDEPPLAAGPAPPGSGPVTRRAPPIPCRPRIPVPGRRAARCAGWARRGRHGSAGPGACPPAGAGRPGRAAPPRGRRCAGPRHDLPGRRRTGSRRPGTAGPPRPRSRAGSPRPAAQPGSGCGGSDLGR